MFIMIIRNHKGPAIWDIDLGHNLPHAFLLIYVLMVPVTTSYSGPPNL